MNRKLLWAVLMIGLALLLAPLAGYGLLGGRARAKTATHRTHPTPA